MPLYDSFNLSNSQYIPQFVGQPLATIERVGDELQDRHYQNIARASQLELLGMQQKANAESDADKAYIDQQLAGIKDALSTMAQTGAENSSSKISALANRFLGDEGLITIQKSIDARNRERAMIEQLQAQGKTPIMNQRNLQNFINRGSFDPETGKWSAYTPTTQQQLDYVTAQDKIVDPLQADLYQTDLATDMKTTLQNLGINVPNGDMSKIPAYLKTTIVKRLSEDKVNQFIDSKGGWEGYKTTPEYKQQKEILGLSDREIKEQLRSRGQARVFEQIQKDWERNPALGLLDGSGKDKDARAIVGEQLPNEAIKVEPAISNFDKFVFKDRQDQVPVDPNIKNPILDRNYAKYGQFESYKGIDRNIKESEWKALNTYARTGAEVFGTPEAAAKFKDLNSKSDPALLAEAAQYAKQYQDLVTQRQTFNIKDVTFMRREGEEGRANADDVTKDVVDNLRSRAIYDPLSGKMIPVLSQDGDSYSDDFQKYIGSPKNLRVTGSLDPQNYLAKQLKNDKFADAYVVDVADPEDPSKTRQVYITRRAYEPSENRNTAFNRITNKIYSEVDVEPGVRKTLDIYGRKVVAQELIGNQLADAMSQLSEEDRAIIGAYQMPILAEIPGHGPQIFNGAKHLADFLLTNQ